MKKKPAADTCAFLLVLLFAYSATVKWLDFPGFRADMGRQPLPGWLQQPLVLLLPFVEILAAVLLTIPRLKLPGFYLSAAIMALFTVYVSMVLLHVFNNVPCSCGGLIRYLTWKQHFVFNLIFLAAAVAGILLHKKQTLLLQ